jgi:hypothetical protein
VGNGRARGLWAAASAIVALIPTACVVPIRSSPAVEGSVVDAETGRPVAGAVVVVRYDGRTHDALPDRDVIAHEEAQTDALGQFLAGPLRSFGLAVWPLLRIEARVVSVLRDGYLCARPRPIAPGEPLEIRLEAARDSVERRESCRPLSAREGEAPAYTAAWRALFPTEAPERPQAERQMDRVLWARSVLGFGQNCEGPVMDLALAPGGDRAALLVAGREGIEVQAAELTATPPGVARGVGWERRSPPRRIAWTSPRELVLWQPASRARRAISPSRLAGDGLEVVWTASGSRSLAPAAPALGLRPSRPRAPLDPADLNDEGDALWLGRSFAIHRTLDPKTGLASEQLRITRQDGSSTSIELPGEACGPAGRFGRPHYRIATSGRTALDLRFVDGGCHALAIDLEDGAPSRLDHADGGAVCRETRRIPAGHLGLALRGYTRELEAALTRSGADPAAAYALRIASDGAVTVETRDFEGRPRRLAAARFPVATPLRLIEVSVVGASTPASESAPLAVPSPKPL